MKIGILGGGQLGRMLALAGIPGGHRFRFYDTEKDCPAGGLGDLCVGTYDDIAAIGRFARGLDVVTYEFENIPVEAAAGASLSVPVFPSPRALGISQDRFEEKNFFASLGIPTARFVNVVTPPDLRVGARELGFPCILKTRRSGYDGKGQVVLRTVTDVDDLCGKFPEVPSILEESIPFRQELSIVAVRSKRRDILYYPLTHNVHRDGILAISRSPAENVPLSCVTEAESYAAKVLTALDYVGVLAIELFQTDKGLIVNEMAPRVHNSGHWTIEGAETSQFENHIRAICGYPLGSTRQRSYCAMINLIGEIPDTRHILELPGVHLHLYGKEPRANRKLGHITISADTRDSLESRMKEVAHFIRL